MDLGLADKVALVIGGSQGIGAEIVRALGREGARLAVAARGQAGLAAIVDELRAAGAEAISIATDMTKSGDADRAVAATLSQYGRLDILIVSVGAARGGTFWEIDEATWAEALDLKFMGLVRALRAAVPVMRAAGGGRIVAIVGNTGRQPNALMLPGSAANAACLAVIKGLADAVAGDGITVNALNPGPTRTARWDRLIADMAAKAARPAGEIEVEQLSRQPLGRIADARSMAQLAVVLASDLADWVTGTSITADGGATGGLA